MSELAVLDESDSQEKLRTCWHEALHGLGFALFGHSCVVTIFDDTHGQTKPIDPTPDYNASMLLVAAASGALGVRLYNAELSGTDLTRSDGYEAFCEIAKNDCDFGADRVGMVNHIKEIFGSQSPDANTAAINLVCDYVDRVLSNPEVKRAAKEVANLLFNNSEVILKCDATGFCAELPDAVTTVEEDVLNLRIESGRQTLNSFRNRWASLRRWRGVCVRSD